MNGLLVEDLRDQLSRGQAMVVVGAGVSVAATDGMPTASWQGLLRSGVDHCEGVLAEALPPGWGGRIRAQIDSGDLHELLSAAENVSLRLGAPGGGEYGRWLKDSVGSLRAVRPEIIEAIHALDAPILTTNYDNLIEDVTSLLRVTWRQEAEVEELVRRDQRGVLHLHGHWREPASVILGIRSYEQVLGSEHAQVLQQALAMLKSLVFVGFGAGLEDPNFAALRDWLRRARAGSRYRHFRLGRDGDIATLQAQHDRAERIVLIGHGPDHDSLVEFLRALAPKASPRATAQPTRGDPPAGDPAPVVRAATGRSSQEEKDRLMAALDGDHELYVAMDLGGTKAYVSLMNGEVDRLFDKRFLTTSHEDPEGLLSFIEHSIEETIREIDRRYAIDPQEVWARVRAIGIAFPGPTDHERGLILDAPNFRIKNFPLASGLEQHFDKPTSVENDVNLGVLGEAWRGSAKDYRDVVGIMIGTGIGGGIIVGGRIYRGKNKTAGEIGHMVLDLDSKIQCGCKQFGCFEALASRQAMARDLARRKAARGTRNRRWLARNLGSNEIADHYQRGDADAIQVVERAAGFCGKAVFSILNLFNPDIIVFGGGFVQQLGDRFLVPVRAEARKCMNAVYSLDENEIPIVIGELDNPMLTGACMMAIERHLGRKEHDLRQVMAAAVRGLDEESFQLLESLYEDETPVLIAGHHPEMDFNEDRLRPLRNRGLVETVAEDQSVGRSFRRSRWVRLSELGKIVAEDLPTRHQ